MKVKHLIAIYLFAFILMILGALFKIMHWPYGPELLTISTAIKTVVALLAIYKVLTTDKFREFLNL